MKKKKDPEKQSVFKGCAIVQLQRLKQLRKLRKAAESRLRAEAGRRGRMRSCEGSRGLPLPSVCEELSPLVGACVCACACVVPLHRSYLTGEPPLTVARLPERRDSPTLVEPGGAGFPPTEKEGGGIISNNEGEGMKAERRTCGINYPPGQNQQPYNMKGRAVGT